MQHYAFHIGDYAKATSHLTPLEDIAYRRLIDLYYDTEGHIPYDVTKAARRVRLDVEPVTQVLQEFFVDTGTEWKHVRCDAEMEKIYEKSDKARESGKRSGEVRRAKAQQTHSEPIANDERTLNERSTNVELPVTRNPLPVSKPKAEAQKPATATRLPADWMPLDADYEFIIKERPDLAPNAVADSFRDYWIGVAGARGRKVDWSATWRNWVRKENKGGVRNGINRESCISDFTGQGRGQSAVLDGSAYRVVEGSGSCV